MPVKDDHKIRTKEKGFLISVVDKNSPAEAAGLKSGWKIFRIDNCRPTDIIDYKIMESGENVSVLAQDEPGLFRRIKTVKKAGEGLGLAFDPPTLNELQRCGNRCIFCFIDQNPGNMRSSLYLKDDDYRLSFLYGNFITLNRLTESEIKRIIKLQLDPLYVSVHTTNPALRVKMFGSKRAERGLRNLKSLADNGIKIHAQVVLCPGINTGEELNKTINDLAGMGKSILSVALVPVGLTGYRQDLETISSFTAGEASKLVSKIGKMQKKYLLEKKSRFVFLADEFYTLAGIDYPPSEEYEGFPQLENGVGLARLFLDELDKLTGLGIKALQKDLKITVAAGSAAKGIIEELKKSLSSIKGLNVNIEIIDNRFFGGHVSVTGLLTGSDIKSALEGKEIGDVLFISKSMLKDQSAMFLDDTDIPALEAGLNTKIIPVSGPLELIQKIVDIDRARQSF